jgi:hypothetical protein
MLHTSTNVPSKAAHGRIPSAHTVLGAAEHGVYTALLATAGFIVVSLLRVAERRDARMERRGR